MSTLEKKLYKEVEVKSNKRPSAPVQSRAYRGLSTVNPENNSYNLYDIALIKQDIINHFHIRMGEKLERPDFGTIIWDVLFEPMTDQLKEAIANNVTDVINYDPRVQVEGVTIDTYESGIMIECTLTYLPYNISESMRLKFDEDNAITSV
jgi:phage baseplate assembly protein W